MSSGSLSLGRIAGIPFLLHWSVVLVGVLLGSGLAAQYGWGGAALALAGFLGSILAHELAHALVARRFGISTQSIQLWALGGVARLDREATTPRAEGWIAAAGPLTSLAIGATSLAAMFVLASADVADSAAGILGWLGIINVALAVFNLLPGAPLDGGRILKAARWRSHGDRYRAAREAGSAGRALGLSLAAFGAVMVFQGRPGVMIVVTGLFIALNAKGEMMAADVAERLQGVRVGELTWFGVAHASGETDADTILWQRSRLGEAGIVAVDREGGDPRSPELVGIVSEEQLLALPRDQRQWVTLSSLMLPLSHVTRAHPDEELASVLSRLDPRAPVVTVWREGKLEGVVPRKRLLARLKAATTPT
jgi:Zn-dependent protease